jgi:hypothetical protein
MTSDQKAAAIKSALQGFQIHDLLPGNDNAAAVREVAGTGYVPGLWMDRKGIHAKDGTITWTEVLGIVAEGCGDGRRTYYEATHAELQLWTASTDRSELSAADRYERVDWLSRITRITEEATAAIIEAGCERYMAPEPLFDMGAM